MQFIVLSQQLLSVLQALIFGAVSCAVYDGVRLLRYILRPEGRGSITLANIFDVIYSVALGCAFSIFLYIVNNGRFRWYLMAGAVFGFALYRLSLGRLTVPVLRRIAKLFRKTLCFVLRTAAIPFRAVIKLVKIAAGRISLRRKNKRLEKEKLLREKTAGSGRKRKRGGVGGHEEKGDELYS